MYHSAASEIIETLKKEYSAGYDGPDGQQRRFYDMGFAIVKSNLALRYPGFPAAGLERQYEQVLGTMISGRYAPGLKQAVDPCTYDVLGRAYESLVHANGTRRGTGEFYTPAFVVDYMVGLLDLDSDDRLQKRRFIDIACGPGAFLVSAMRKVIRLLRQRGMDDADLLRTVARSFYGQDINPLAVDICKINLYIVLLNELGPETLVRAGPLKLNVFTANSVDRRDENVAQTGRFDYILGNPPYLEAKRMPAEIKAACRESWPDLKGAFDLYVPFILQCNRLVAKNGKVCLILPDKFTVAHYGVDVRNTLLSDFSILELADLSGMGIFSRAMVYPTAIAYRNIRPSQGHVVRTRMSVRSPKELADPAGMATVPQDLYCSIGHNKTLFAVPPQCDMAALLRGIFEEGTPISRFVRFRSTVSFHKKGLREQFVGQSFDSDAGPVHKYLGGRSFTRRNEVDMFRFRWEGFYINYDQSKLKEYNNVLPPLSNFRQEKIVLCQHAPRITAAYDGAGEFVTKDVYPIGIAAPGLAESPLSLKYFTVLLNTELMSFVYGTVYKGIQIGGGYYHYLPTWIDVLPVIMPAEKEIRLIERLADKMIEADDRSEKLQLMRKADDIVYRIYGVDGERQAVIKSALPPRDVKDR